MRVLAGSRPSRWNAAARFFSRDPLDIGNLATDRYENVGERIIQT
jgi:hypothetical protein